MALRDLAGDRVVDHPDRARDELHLPPDEGGGAVLPRPRPRATQLADVARDHGARFIHDNVAEVEPERRSSAAAAACTSRTTISSSPPARRPSPAFQHALTFGADPAERRLHGLLADLEQGYIHSVAFVVPPEAAWTLPLYEIALMTARQAWSMGMDRSRSRS